MKKIHPPFILLCMAVLFVLALSVPLSSVAEQNGRAVLLESIQRQLVEIAAAITRIQVRIVELLREAAGQQTVVEPVLPEPIPEEKTQELSVPEKAPEARVSASEKQTSVVSTEPVRQFVPVPTTYLANGLVVLYRFSIAAGTVDAIVPSVTYTITFGDVSIKDLEVYAFSDELFSVKAFTNTTKKNLIGKRTGYVESGGQAVLITLENDTSQIVVSAGKTYYFELRGTTAGKNVSAFATVSGEGLQEVRLE